MPTPLKVAIAINVAFLFALALLGLIAGGGFISGVFPPDAGHEIKLIPIRQDDARGPSAIEQPAQRAEIPREYRTPDPTPRPWVAMPDGSVRFVRSD